MQFVSRFILFLSILFCWSSAMAYEGHGFQILSEKIEKSPGLEGGFIPIGKSLPTPLLAEVWSQAHAVNGQVAQTIRLWGSHSIYIINSTPNPQIYSYSYELNCDGQFYRKTDQVKVAPGGSMKDSLESFIFTTHFATGSWPISVITDVRGESSAHQEAKALLRISR